MAERWWDGEPDEIFWMEITDRDDLGSDLNAPGRTETGRQYWSYRFVREVRDGDIVLHYRARPVNAITAWSRAAGEPYRDQVFWGAHGQASGRGPVTPYWRPGWRRPLDGPYELSQPVTAAFLNGIRSDVVRVLGEIDASHPKQRIYAPFVEYGGRELRAFQGYLTKVPRALVELVPELADVARIAAETRPRPTAPAPRLAVQPLVVITAKPSPRPGLRGGSHSLLTPTWSIAPCRRMRARRRRSLRPCVRRERRRVPQRRASPSSI